MLHKIVTFHSLLNLLPEISNFLYSLLLPGREIARNSKRDNSKEASFVHSSNHMLEASIVLGCPKSSFRFIR